MIRYLSFAAALAGLTFWATLASTVAQTPEAQAPPGSTGTSPTPPSTAPAPAPPAQNAASPAQTSPAPEQSGTDRTPEPRGGVPGTPGAPAKPSAPGASAGTGAAPARPPEPVVERTYATTIPLSIEDAVRMALENNLELKVSRVEEDLRGRDLVVSRSVFDPFFNVGTSFAKNRDPSVSFFDVGAGGAAQGVNVSPSETLSYYTSLTGTWMAGTRYEIRLAQVERDRPVASQAGFTFLNPVTSTDASALIRQPLLKGAWFDYNTSEIRIAQNNLKLSREQVELTAMNTVYLTEKAYWELAFSLQNLEAKSKTYKVALENLENVRIKRTVGTLAAIDVTTAESQAAIRRVELEEALELREAARDALLDQINYSKERSLKERWQLGDRKSPYDAVMIVCSSAPSPELLPTSRDSALSAAFERRPEYRQAELNVDSQKIRIDAAKNQLLPALDLTGSWNQLGLQDTWTGSYKELNTGRYYDWSVGVEFSVPLSNRGPRSRYRNARDELRKLHFRQSDLENQIVLEVDQAIRRLEFLRRKVADLDERVRLQEELLRAERRKVDVGMSIAYTVSVIENDLVENQTQALRARADLQIGKTDLQRAMGTLLDQYRIKIESNRS